MTYRETNLVASIERLSGAPLVALAQPQRDHVDQFHAGGAEAVDRLLPGLGLTPAMTVLDVGSGLGGPARQVARSAGCRVVGVDITPAYVEAARALTDAAGLSERVGFECTDLAALDATEFDAAYTVHVQMNVADKTRFFGEIARRLRPGARFAVFGVCRNGAAVPVLPLPWSLVGTDSHLVAAEELRATIESCGFELLDWADESAWIRQWFEQTPARVAAAATRALLPALLQDGPRRMTNFAAALFGGVVSVHRGCFTRTRAVRPIA
jgi:cyclopropane fatty-acyl-phospholipid synthase-like methyltransferase